MQFLINKNLNKKWLGKYITLIAGLHLLILMIILTGCGATSRVYLHPQTDLGYIRRVAVGPFENLTNERYAGEKITQSFIAELLIAGDFNVVEPGEVTRAIRTVRAANNQPIFTGSDSAILLDLTRLNRLSQELDCQGIIIGSVTSYEMIRVGSEQYPQISINVRLVDGKTGTIVWMSTFTKRGGPGFPFIGFGEKYTLSELSQDICRNIVSAISKKL